MVLADTQDNPGAGGNGDTTGLLKALVRQDAPDAVLGLLVDGAAAKQAHEMGKGATAAFRLGGRSGIAGDSPLEGEFTVEQLGDGKFTCTGPMSSARMPASIFDRSPTTTQVRVFASSVRAAALTCSGVSASTSALRRVTQSSGRS